MMYTAFIDMYIYSVPTLDQVDPSDRKAIFAARNQKIRDDWVKAMEARIIKEKLDECYRTEGVNHCKPILSPLS
ncbi:uncharacterized protein B0P05DRAFT_345994 [Gilbertella persicaria]|uniref:uncharacterized protein n=1 Tax=Gilbertella persicaria TaxID=101096 RepID=UPI00222093E6|nr:uncharacterized protein B0P05DRAFT_345994 [Gilbertella persicaria]KAI8047820.1 hypothetical protein B0P05DRAFT_345994 [Gilbertella persicaria]